MSTEQMKVMISWAYPGNNWLFRVKQMSEAQVYSVYMRLMNSGKLEGIKLEWGMRTK